jgi:site-specific recombinase XerD
MEYLSINEVKQLLVSVNDARDRLIIRVLYETGCELTELVNMDASDVLGHTIRINGRYAQVSGKLAKDLSLYIHGNGMDAKLFLTRQSGSISEKRIRQLIQKHSLNAFGRAITSQALRYSHIIHAYSSGVLLDNIAKQIGITPLRIFQIIADQKIMKHNYNQFLGRI